MVKGTKGNSTKKTSNQGTDQKSRRTSSRGVTHPATATVADVNRLPKVEMTGTEAEKLKLVAAIVSSIIGEPIHNTEVPPAAVDEVEPLPEEEPQEEAEEKLTAGVGAPLDSDFSRLHFLAETSAVAEQLLNGSHTTESLK